MNADHPWLVNTKSDEFAADVFDELYSSGDQEEFGRSRVWSLLEGGAERLTRLIKKVPDIISHAGVGLIRKPLTRKIATFIGDAFQYLAERGDGTRPGPIALTVIEQLKAAYDKAKRTGEPLVVICHSFGGEIVYDILTHYADQFDLEVDVWVTVGSQVGLFEEMSLFSRSLGRAALQAKFDNEAIPSPQRAKRWINIVDTNDVLGFAVLPVFTGATPGAVQDFKYDTGYPVTGAHSGYFEWPSFYKRLAQRISEISST